MGIAPSEFWRMTPWQLGVLYTKYAERLDSKHDHDAWMMYHGAVLTRVKKVPPLKNYLAAAFKKPKKGIDENDIKARMRAHNRREESKK